MLRRAGEHRVEVPGIALSRTSCGREIVVGALLFPGVSSIGRVTLRVNCRRDELGHLWMSLTAEEARLLAAALVARAETVELACEHGVESGE